jgi:hypothetical protein
VGREDPAYFQILETELDNFRAALNWSLTGHKHPEDALRLAGTLRFVWYITYQTEGMEWFTAVLERNEQVSDALRVKALNDIALIASFHGNYSQMKMVCRETVAIAQKAKDKHEIGLPLELFGVALQWRANWKMVYCYSNKRVILPKNKKISDCEDCFVLISAMR